MDPMLDCCFSKMSFQGFLRYKFTLKLTPIRSPQLTCKQDVVCGADLCSCFLWVCPCARCYLTPLSICLPCDLQNCHKLANTCRSASPSDFSVSYLVTTTISARFVHTFYLSPTSFSIFPLSFSIRIWYPGIMHDPVWGVYKTNPGLWSETVFTDWSVTLKV